VAIAGEYVEGKEMDEWDTGEEVLQRRAEESKGRVRGGQRRAEESKGRGERRTEGRVRGRGQVA